MEPLCDECGEIGSENVLYRAYLMRQLCDECARAEMKAIQDEESWERETER